MVSLYRSWSLLQPSPGPSKYGKGNNFNNRNNHHHHFSPFPSLTRGATCTTTRESLSFINGYLRGGANIHGNEDDIDDFRSSSALLGPACQLSYSDQLQDYIVRYKRRPPDIKHWPYGPYWPHHFDGLLLNTPRHLWSVPKDLELLAIGDFGQELLATSRTIDNQSTPYKGKWRGVQVAFDSERSSRDFHPLSVPEGCCPSLVFESRFECGNLRQARRIAQFEYELVLKSDLYTLRHTQWYYFRVSNAVPGVTYKLRIVNLLKRDSLYNHGMRPLLYSENDAQEKQRGWVRCGHHISYSRNVTNHNCPLLQRGVTYHMLEWQMEFHNADDTYYLAHCYPYSFTDLKEDLDVLMNSEERAQVAQRQVLCETRAGNSCFLLTVTNFESKEEKKGVVITGRVHPGESQASWMMKGLLEFITGPDPVAQDLRNKFIFKIVPMLNPDGVIVGNYRCSLAARDLNRNYRHPRRESFPVIWHVKNMVDELAKSCEVSLYCDLHGHSRKPNTFMYGNNTSVEGDITPIGAARAFISERLFPWLMSKRSPDKFHFKSCKFQIRRCKESTGRVVMWRQMKIFNSFTLEATFSGTVMDKDNCRHFNILDFMEMGKVLAQTVLDYHNVQEDQGQQSQAILGLTRVITEQILTSKGLIEPGTTLKDFNSDKGSVDGGEAAKVQESAEKWTGALLALLNTPRDVNGTTTTSSSSTALATASSSSLKDSNTTKAAINHAHEEKNSARPSLTNGGAESKSAVFTRDDVAQMLESLTGGRSMEDCLSLLADLDVQNGIDESDSSDSDSESEPEMKPPEPKHRKKKRKSKKQRDKDNEKKSGTEKKNSVEEPRVKSLSNLPALSASTRAGASNPSSAQTENSSVSIATNKQATSNPDKSRVTRQMSSFISKYEGRHNGGVPCFTEERSMERAAKRMAEIRRKHEDHRNGKDLTFYCVDETGMHQYSSEDLAQRFHELGEGNPNISASLLGMNVRTGYTHADNFQDLSPSPTLHQNGGNSGPISSLSTQSYRPEQGELLEQSCSTEDSNSDSNDIDGEGSASNDKNFKLRCYSISKRYKSRQKHVDDARKHSLTSERNKSSHTTPSTIATTNGTNPNHKSSRRVSVGADNLSEMELCYLPLTARKNPYHHLDPIPLRSFSSLSVPSQPHFVPQSMPITTNTSLAPLPQTMPIIPTEMPVVEDADTVLASHILSFDSRTVPGESSDQLANSSIANGSDRTIGRNYQLQNSHISSSKTPSTHEKQQFNSSPSNTIYSTLKSFSNTDHLQDNLQTKAKLSSLNGKPTNGEMDRSLFDKGRSPTNCSIFKKLGNEINGTGDALNVDKSTSKKPRRIYQAFAVSDDVLNYTAVNDLANNRNNIKDYGKHKHNNVNSKSNRNSNNNNKNSDNNNVTDNSKPPRRSWSLGNLDGQTSPNIDQLVNSLAQNLSGVESRLAKRHAVYKTTHLRAMSRSGGVNSGLSGATPSPLQLASPTGHAPLPFPHHHHPHQHPHHHHTPTRLATMQETLYSSPLAGSTSVQGRDDKGKPAGRNSTLSLRGPSQTPNALHSPSYMWE